MGDKAPADLVLVSSKDLKVDNSSLTGESEPQERRALPSGTSNRPIEAENLVCLLQFIAFRRMIYTINLLRYSTRPWYSAAKAGEVIHVIV